MEDEDPDKPRQAFWRSGLAVPKTPRNVILFALILLGAANFIVFVTVAHLIGGDAINGRVEGGRYFVADHGHLHEVSKAVFTYSLWHARSLFLSHPLALLAGWLLVRDIMRTRKGTPPS